MPKLPNAIHHLPEHNAQPLPLGHEAVGRAAVAAAENETYHSVNGANLDDYQAYLSHDQGYLAMDEQLSENEYRDRVSAVLERSDNELPSEDEVKKKYGSYARVLFEVNEQINDFRPEAAADLRQATSEKTDSIQQTREALANLKVRNKNAEVYAGYAFDEAPAIFSHWHTDSNEATGKDESWVQWLAKSASNEQLLNVMQWHNERLRKCNQDPEIQASVEARRTQYQTGVERLFEEDYLHPDSQVLVMAQLKNLKVYAADPIDLAQSGARGQANLSKKQVYILPELLLDSEANTFEHELSHFVISDDEQWVEEFAADLVAGMVRSDTQDIESALVNILNDDGNGYQDVDGIFGQILSRYPGATKYFLRYVSAPDHKKQACRKELNDALEMSGADLLEALTPDMKRILARNRNVDIVESVASLANKPA